MKVQETWICKVGKKGAEIPPTQKPSSCLRERKKVRTIAAVQSETDFKELLLYALSKLEPGLSVG